MNSHRREERKEVVRPVYFFGEKHAPRFAFSVNLSSCGLCIITNRPITLGEKVRLHTRFFWDEPRDAMTVWVKEINYKTYKVGMELCSLRIN